VKREGNTLVCLCVADTVCFWDIKKNVNPSKISGLSGVFELVCAMLLIGRAANRSFQPVVPPVWIKEFPLFSRSPPGYNCDFGVWAGIGADFGDGPLRSITRTDAQGGPQ
jgi:hypothetical protein